MNEPSAPTRGQKEYLYAESCLKETAIFPEDDMVHWWSETSIGRMACAATCMHRNRTSRARTVACTIVIWDMNRREVEAWQCDQSMLSYIVIQSSLLQHDSDICNNEEQLHAT